jgi:hypothetical protein
MNEKIAIHKRGLKARLDSLGSWAVPDGVKRDLRAFLDDLELGKVNKGRKISESRRLKYLDMLKPSLEFWNKPTEALELADVETLIRR